MRRAIVSIILALALMLPSTAMAVAHLGAHEGHVQHRADAEPDAEPDMHSGAHDCDAAAQESPAEALCCDDAIGHCATTAVLGPSSVSAASLGCACVGQWADIGGLLPGRPGATDPPPPRT